MIWQTAWHGKHWVYDSEWSEEMRRKRTIACSLVLSMGLSWMCALPVTAKTVSELQNEQASVNSSIEQKKDELNSKSSLKNETVAKIKEITDSINATEQKIAAYNTQISEQEKTIEETNKKIAVTEEALATSKKTLDDRLVSIYKDDNINYLGVIFQAENMSDLLTRVEYLSYITKRDKEIVDTVSNAKTELDEQKATLEQQLQSLNALKAEQEEVRTLLADQQVQQQSAYEALSKDEAALKESIAVMQSTSEEIGQKIVSLQKATATYEALNPYETDEYEVEVAGEGIWPAPDSHVVTSSYGGRNYPLDGSYDFHLGTDIAADYGTPVISFKGGTVIIADYHWSYGNYVVVDHGNGMSTLYGHMSSLNVSAGDTVAAGQRLGSIGSTGSSTGPHLHFEVRINGVVEDAATYLGI